VTYAFSGKNNNHRPWMTLKVIDNEYSPLF